MLFLFHCPAELPALTVVSLFWGSESLLTLHPAWSGRPSGRTCKRRGSREGWFGIGPLFPLCPFTFLIHRYHELQLNEHLLAHLSYPFILVMLDFFFSLLRLWGGRSEKNGTWKALWKAFFIFFLFQYISSFVTGSAHNHSSDHSWEAKLTQ